MNFLQEVPVKNVRKMRFTGTFDGRGKKKTVEKTKTAGYLRVVIVQRPELETKRSSQKFVMRRVLQLLGRSKKTQKTNSQQCISHSNKNMSFLFFVLDIFFSQNFCWKT